MTIKPKNNLRKEVKYILIIIFWKENTIFFEDIEHSIVKNSVLKVKDLAQFCIIVKEHKLNYCVAQAVPEPPLIYHFFKLLYGLCSTHVSRKILHKSSLGFVAT